MGEYGPGFGDVSGEHGPGFGDYGCGQSHTRRSRRRVTIDLPDINLFKTSDKDVSVNTPAEPELDLLTRVLIFVSIVAEIALICHCTAQQLYQLQ